MKIYVLDMTKPRWEIVENKIFTIEERHLKEIKRDGICRYNNSYTLSDNKNKLKEYADKVIEHHIDIYRKNLSYYENMNVKITRL